MQKRSRRINENSKQGRIWAKTDGYCHLCGTRLYVGEWHLDHIVPRVHHGADDEHNLLPYCVFCNGMKKAATTYRMRRLLMYGRYCLEKATRRDKSPMGQDIYALVERRVKATAKRFRKVMGYRHLPKLRDALKRELKIDTTTSKKKAA